jgi:hypothetical protein
MIDDQASRRQSSGPALCDQHSVDPNGEMEHGGLLEPAVPRIQSHLASDGLAQAGHVGAGKLARRFIAPPAGGMTATP